MPSSLPMILLCLVGSTRKAFRVELQTALKGSSIMINVYRNHSLGDVPPRISEISNSIFSSESWHLPGVVKYFLTNSCTLLCTQPNFLRSFRERKGRRFWPRSSVIKQEKRATCALSAPKTRSRGGGRFLSAFSVQKASLRSRERLLGIIYVFCAKFAQGRVLSTPNCPK